MDPEDAERIYSEQRVFAYTIARRWLPHHDAEDVVQEAGIALLRAEARPGESDQDITIRVTLNAIRCLYANRHARKRGGNGDGTGKAPGPRTVAVEYPLDLGNDAHHPATPSAERVAMGRIELAEAMRTAPREALLRAAGYSLREIAGIMGQSMDASRARLERWVPRDRHGAGDGGGGVGSRRRGPFLQPTGDDPH